MKPETVIYLRQGRVKRASGTKIDEAHGHIKVLPSHPGWGAVWLSPAEVAAGAEKPPLVPRKKQDGKKHQKRPRKVKPPTWRALVDQVRANAAKQLLCFGELSPELQTQVELCDHLEAAQTLFKP